MSWLSDKQLLSKIKRNGDLKTLKAFGGIFAIDQLPQSIPHYPFLAVINTQSHNLPGEHWIAIYINEKRRGEVFDSLATPTNAFLSRWMNRHTRSWRRNSHRFQNPLSSSCGAFVLFYILQRCECDMMKCVTKRFTASFPANEKLVRDFYKRL